MPVLEVAHVKCGCVWDDDVLVSLCHEHNIENRGELMPCGCRREQTEEHDVILVACDQHVHPWKEFESKVSARLGYELDVWVREAATGKRVKRIYDVPEIVRR